MIDTLLSILPIIGIIVLGYLLRSGNIFTKDYADLFLKTVYYVAAPALILLSIMSIELNTTLLLLPLMSIIVFVVMSAISLNITPLLGLSKQSSGSFMLGTIILNTGFLIPFFIAVHGNTGLAHIALFDAGVAIATFSLGYYIACRHNSNNTNTLATIKKIISSPPLWALILGIILNYTNTTLTPILKEFFTIIGNMTVPLLLLALGIYFTPKFTKTKLLTLGIIMRMGVGFLIGYILVNIFDFEGLVRTTVLIGSAAPIGYSTLIFSSLENLDSELAAQLISIGLLLGVIIMPILLAVL